MNNTWYQNPFNILSFSVKNLLIILILMSTKQIFANTYRLGIGDGTLPLRLNGIATEELSPHISLDSEFSLISIRSPSSYESQLFQCSQNSRSAQKYISSGYMIIGFEKFTIQSICSYMNDHVELFGSHGERSIKMSGRLYKRRAQIYRFTGQVEMQFNGKIKKYKFDALQDS